MPEIMVRQHQLAFFLENAPLLDRLNIARVFREEFGEDLSGEPTILPIPNDAPLEIPRIILSSPDKTIICNISPLRVDLIINLNSSQATPELVKKAEDLTPYIKSLTKVILTHLKWKINRLAYIKSVELNLKGGVIRNMSSKVTEDISQNAAQLQIHKMQTVKIDESACNHWIRIISENPGEENEKIVILSDLNTLQKEQKEFGQAEIIQFFTKGMEYADKVISHLF